MAYLWDAVLCKNNDIFKKRQSKLHCPHPNFEEKNYFLPCLWSIFICVGWIMVKIDQNNYCQAQLHLQLQLWDWGFAWEVSIFEMVARSEDPVFVEMSDFTNLTQTFNIRQQQVQDRNSFVRKRQIRYDSFLQCLMALLTSILIRSILMKWNWWN